MALPFNHTFNTASNVSLTAYGNGFIIDLGAQLQVNDAAPDRCFANDPGICSGLLTGEAHNADHEVTIIPKQLTGTAFIGATVRHQAAGNGNYYGWWANNGTAQLFKSVAGVHTNLTLDSGALPSGVQNETMKLRATGSTIILYMNGVEQCRATDTTYATGKTGIVGKNGSSGAAYIETFLADNVGGGTSAIAATLAGTSALAAMWSLAANLAGTSTLLANWSLAAALAGSATLNAPLVNAPTDATGDTLAAVLHGTSNCSLLLEVGGLQIIEVDDAAAGRLARGQKKFVQAAPIATAAPTVPRNRLESAPSPRGSPTRTSPTEPPGSNVGRS